VSTSRRRRRSLDSKLEVGGVDIVAVAAEKGLQLAEA